MKIRLAILMAGVSALPACTSPSPPAVASSPPTTAKGRCDSGAVTWGAATSRNVIVAASPATNVVRNREVSFTLQPVASVRSHYTADREFPSLAGELTAAYAEKTGSSVAPFGQEYDGYERSVTGTFAGDTRAIRFQAVHEDTVAFTYTCADGTGRAGGTMSVWAFPNSGTVSCSTTQELPAEVRRLQESACR